MYILLIYSVSSVRIYTGSLSIQNDCRDACTSAIEYYQLYMYLSVSIAIVENVAAFGTELGRIGRISGSPAALVALEYLSTCRLG